MKHLKLVETISEVVQNSYITIYKCEEDGNVYYTPPLPPNYLTFTANVDDSFVALRNIGGNAPVIYWSKDKSSWTKWDYYPINLSQGESVYMYGDNPKGINSSVSKYSSFEMSGSIAASGNIQSLLSIKCPNEIPCDYCYYNMFYYCALLTEAPELPATTLKDGCYISMFQNCASLTEAPELPATTLKYGCYQDMFDSCTSLTEAPKLPATTLANYCYERMFNGCSSLTEAPELPATTLTDACYYGMFNGCTSLTTAPELPATTLSVCCYFDMFNGCRSLTEAPELPATTLVSQCYYSMFEGCSSLTKAPSILPATTLESYCYCAMFKNCTSLTTAPELPATTFGFYCYSDMFEGCSKLNYIKVGATSWSTDLVAGGWVSGVSSTGTFVQPLEATWTDRGTNAIPNGWTVVKE